MANPTARLARMPMIALSKIGFTPCFLIPNKLTTPAIKLLTRNQNGIRRNSPKAWRDNETGCIRNGNARMASAVTKGMMQLYQAARTSSGIRELGDRLCIVDAMRSQANLELEIVLQGQQRFRIALGVVNRVVGVDRLAQMFEVLRRIPHDAFVKRSQVGG